MIPSFTRRSVLGASVLGVGALLTGCRAGGGSSNAISYWSGFEGAPIREYVERTLVAEFADRHPGSELRLVYKTPEELERDVRLALAAGTAPDIVETNGPAFIPELARQGYLADLTAVGERLGWSEQLMPWVPSLGTVDDKLYAIPIQFETLGIFYNADVFDRFGYRPPRTRADLEDLCDDLIANKIIPFAAGNRDFAQTIEWYTSVYFSNYVGPHVMHEVLTGRRPWTTDLMVEAAALMLDHFRRGYYAGSVEKYFTTSFNAVRSDVATGRAAMDMEGTWFLAEADTFFTGDAGTTRRWDFASFPALRDEVSYPLYPIGTGGTLSVSASSADVDLAAGFLDLLIGDRSAAARRIADFPAEFSLPLRFAEADFPTTMDPRVRRVYLELLSASGRNIGYTNWTFTAPRTAVHLYEKAQELITGALSPEAYLQGAERTFQQDLDNGFVPVAIDPGDHE